MADLERSAKPVSQWTNNELLAFNIRVEDAGVEAFFNIPQLPPPTASTATLDNLDDPPGPLLNNDRLFFAYKCSAERAERRLSCIDLTRFLLDLLDYNSGYRLLSVWAKLSLLMGGRRINANIDLFVINELDEYLLIIHEDKVSCLTGTFLRLTVLLSALKPRSRSTSHREGNRRVRPQQF
jgi:hypothetical protein